MAHNDLWVLLSTIGSLTNCRLFLHLEVVSAHKGGTSKQLTVVKVALLTYLEKGLLHQA